jgi:hypothetical protein
MNLTSGSSRTLYLTDIASLGHLSYASSTIYQRPLLEDAQGEMYKNCDVWV